MDIPSDPKKIWDERYARLYRENNWPKSRPWLNRWRWLLDTSGGAPVLDIGCGEGNDSEYLIENGYKVISLDYSMEALRLACQFAQNASLTQVDIRRNLPFRDNAFLIVIANLCLHYFTWAQTRSIIEEIGRILKPNGHLLARFNSTKDTNHGATGHEKIESGYYLVFGMGKRFFDEESLRELFKAHWKFLGCEEYTIQRHEKPKIVWEVILESL
jgi:SAM-dependent methyltransferase